MHVDLGVLDGLGLPFEGEGGGDLGYGGRGEEARVGFMPGLDVAVAERGGVGGDGSADYVVGGRGAERTLEIGNVGSDSIE
jgi:hypothetical protein